MAVAHANLRRHVAAPLLLLLCVLQLTGCRGAATAGDTLDVTIGGERFRLELALDDAQRFAGLSDRDHIAPDGGMLFVFPDTARRAFVMRRCLVPIDIIFLSHNGLIVSMHRMAVEPYDTPEHRLKRYDSGWPAQYAIELAGGTLDRLSLESGRRIDLPHEELRRRAR
jgi:uncharacterized membrane protein (UPF0127 family)